MTVSLKSQQDLFNDFQTEMQTDASDLTDFVEGSINDQIGGVTSSAVREVTYLISDRFRTCFFTTARGPDDADNLGGADEIQILAIDQFGDTFARPAATSSVVDVILTRPTFTAGAGTIPAGTIVKTTPDSNGVSQRFSTLINQSVGSTTLSVTVQASNVVPGPLGNVSIGKITVVESALFDPTFTVNNSVAATGGAAMQDTPTYRQTILNKIETLKGGNGPGIEAAAKTVTGVETATLIETQMVVRQWDIGSSMSLGSPFRIPFSVLYIADANGTASGALIAQVVAQLNMIRAAGVRIAVVAGVAFTVDWTASIVLNPSGPNYADLQIDSSPIVQSMIDYINALPVGTGFTRVAARSAILSIWGPTGTNDLTDFTNVFPVGDISTASYGKAKPGTVVLT